MPGRITEHLKLRSPGHDSLHDQPTFRLPRFPSSPLPRWLWIALITVLGAVLAPAQDPAARYFLDQVKPLLDSRCVSCHGPEKQKGNLRLDTREAALKGGDVGPAVVPGKPGESLLLQAVLHTKADLEMPPKDKLSVKDIAVLERWVREGAPWVVGSDLNHAEHQAGSTMPRLGDAWTDSRNPVTRQFNGQRLDLWSLKPLRQMDPPILAQGPGEVRHPIDRFILARLRKEGLHPSPEADRRTLARRVSFDLIGLPPSAEEMEAFLNDATPGAYERLVDRLLNSPRYGEHQARRWLDVIRYSDSNGFDWDEFRPQAWRFRDYVIRSLNADKPFDQFVREQLAGDEMLAEAPALAEEQDRLIATGFLRLGPQDNSAALFNEQSRARAEWLADLTETTGSAFLGLTLSCCRCHDHKFDPLLQADHFRLRAFFEPVRYGDDLALDLSHEQTAIRSQHAEIEARLRPLTEARDGILGQARQRVRASKVAQLSETDRALLAQTSDPQPQNFKEQAAALAKKVEPSDDEARQGFTADEKARHAELNRQIEALKRQKLPFTRGLLATDTTNQVPVTRIHFQGDPKAERAAVEPGFLSALDPNPAEVQRGANPATTGRRLTLAEWIVSPANPLTARVLVNRAWQSFFGRGLVATPNDFGLAGAAPTHPELLDWLARDLQTQGWSLKRLHRQIVTSATYRQRSYGEASPRKIPGESPRSRAPAEVDGDNTLYWRQNPRRLAAEQLRDAMLSVSGLLATSAGGPPVWPELPAEVLQANPAFLDDNAEKTKGWYPSPPEQRTVRSVYLVQKRTVRVPFLETFDLPENTVSCPQRNVSIVAPQALSLLNGGEPLMAARALAERFEARANGGNTEEVIRAAFREVLQRAPFPAEVTSCRAFLARASLAEFGRALLNLNEFAYLD